jgi:hypothetical protein
VEENWTFPDLSRDDLRLDNSEHPKFQWNLIKKIAAVVNWVLSGLYK